MRAIGTATKQRGLDAAPSPLPGGGRRSLQINNKVHAFACTRPSLTPQSVVGLPTVVSSHAPASVIIHLLPVTSSKRLPLPPSTLYFVPCTLYFVPRRLSAPQPLACIGSLAPQRRRRCTLFFSPTHRPSCLRTPITLPPSRALPSPSGVGVAVLSPPWL